jgi:hypothetical protein
MNNKTNKWTVFISSPNISEAIQLVAFSYGYSWEAYGKKVSYTDKPYLVFDPDLKIIYYNENREYLKGVCCKIVENVQNVSEAVDLLKNPPVVAKDECKVGDFTIARNGDVSIFKGTTEDVIEGETFDDLVVQRNKFLGRDVKPKVRYPEVAFKYLKDGLVVLTERRIALTNSNSFDLFGYDLNDNDQFKRFFWSKIQGPVRVTGNFVEV